MAFTVEDGSQVVGANAYAAVADVEAYLTDRDRVEAFAYQSTVKKQAAIIAATDYVEARWGWRFRGTRLGDSSEQGLSWPRCDAYTNDGTLYPDDEIPPKLIAAIAEYAVRALAGELLADPSTSVDRDVKKKTEKVAGVVEETTEYFADSESSPPTGLRPTIPSYPVADLLMAELVTGDPMASGQVGFGRVVRA